MLGRRVGRLLLAASVVTLGVSVLAEPTWAAPGGWVDCMDGKVARLHGNGSVFGGWLDFFLARLRVVTCVVALFAGQWRQTDDALFLFVAIGVVFLALFGYVNGAETDKAFAQLAQRGHAVPARDDKVLLDSATGPAAEVTSRLRDLLHRHRIRMNLVSGIELEMAVLVVAPVLAALTGAYALVVVAVVAAALLILFELSLIARFWLATRH